MNNLNEFLRAEFEPLQYGIFFGLLAVLALVEMFAFRSANTPKRKRRWPTNFGLTMLNIIVIGALPISGLLVAEYARSHDIGILNVVDVAPVTALILGLFARSFVSWLIHLAMHKVPVLWRVHRVHHTDTHLDVSTTVRFHPLEFIINTPIVVVSILVLGLSPITLMLYELFDAAMVIFTHANIRMPRRLERLVRFVLVTPDMHRVHHSTLQPETDSNFGATFSIWDHLFRTYRDKTPDELSEMQIGLIEFQDDRSQSFWWLLTLPFLSKQAAMGAYDSQLGTETTQEKG